MTQTDTERLVHDRSFCISVGRAFEILHSFSASDKYLGVNEIARRTGLPKTTVSRLTYTLEKLGYLHLSHQTGKYGLCWNLTSLAYPLLSNAVIRQISKPEMYHLSQEIEANVNLAILEKHKLIYVESIRHDETSIARPDIGTAFPIHSTVTGLAMMHIMDRKRRSKLDNRMRALESGYDERVRGIARQIGDEIDNTGFVEMRSFLHENHTVLVAPFFSRYFEREMALNAVFRTGKFDRTEIVNHIAPKLIRTLECIRN